MWQIIQSIGVWHGAGIGAAWFVTICLLLAGAIGCVLPILPGHLIILIAAIAYRLMRGADSGLTGGTFVILILLMVVSQIFEMLSGAAGSRWFGGTKWGALGAIGGSIIGLAFLPFGLLLGPLVGAFLCEFMIAKKQGHQAVISGVGSVVGTLGGMILKIIIGLLMIAWFLINTL